MSMTSPMRVDIWSDVVCPWCYIGKRHFERALESFDFRDQVEVVWHSFELDPSPREGGGDLVSELASKYGSSREQARTMIDRTSERAAQAGLSYDLHHAIPANTFDAHRLIHLAAAHGLQDAAEERLFRAHMCERADIADHATLVRLGVEFGLDEAEAAAALAGGAYGEEVRADERLAREIGVTGVPFFVIEGRYGISGAQPAEFILSGLLRAWSERMEAPLAPEPASNSA
jgi:predicted DsbA family dithiol-disulfide isomerase